MDLLLGVDVHDQMELLLIVKNIIFLSKSPSVSDTVSVVFLIIHLSSLLVVAVIMANDVTDDVESVEEDAQPFGRTEMDN